MSDIYTAINKIMARVGHIGKDRSNQQQGFKYRGIDGFENYMIVDSGHVISLNYANKGTPRLLKGQIVRGYVHVTLCHDGRKCQMSVHRLVGHDFIRPPRPLEVINHKNGDRKDNRVENLEWVSQSDNVIHSYRTGLRVIDEAHKLRAAKLGMAKRKLSDNEASEVRRRFSQGATKTSLSETFGISRKSIHAIVYGNSYKEKYL